MALRGRSNFPEEGGVFFITTSFRGRKRLLRDAKHYAVLIKSLEFLKKKFSFEIWAYVLMPSHIHLIMAFPNGNRLSAVMRDFKKYTAYEIRKLMEEEENYKELEDLREFGHRTSRFKIWETRFDDVVIYSPKVLKIKIDYIHTNPVRAGLCSEPSQWLYSSARDYCGGKSPLAVDAYSFV